MFVFVALSLLFVRQSCTASYRLVVVFSAKNRVRQLNIAERPEGNQTSFGERCFSSML